MAPTDLCATWTPLMYAVMLPDVFEYVATPWFHAFCVTVPGASRM